MSWSILNRTILIELVKVFALALLGMTGILVMAGIVTYASQQGLSPSQILAIIPLIIPDMLPYSVPTTMLFATCIVYGRLAHDNEILAIKAAGINPLKVVWPGVALGLTMSIVTMALYFHTIPYTHHLMKMMFLKDVEELLYTMLKKDGEIKQPGLNYMMWAQRVQGHRLYNAVFKRCAATGNGYDVIAVAKEAELHVDLDKQTLRVEMRHGHVSDEGKEGTRFYFNEREWEVALPKNNAKGKPRTRDMTWPQILERREVAAQEMDFFAAQIAITAARLLLTNPPTDLHKHLSNLHMIHRAKQLELNSLAAELQMRPALSFGCLCFVLVGCPVGIWFSKSDFLSAFITCFLPIVFLYYPLLLCGNNLARDGKLAPAIGIWAANGVMAIIALLMFRQLLRH